MHWLVTEKKADIETSDRGFFTPVSYYDFVQQYVCFLVVFLFLWNARHSKLLNAAWGGNKHLVRLLLQHGADRSKVGTGHYTEALAPSDFQGFNAEDWARKKGL